MKLFKTTLPSLFLIAVLNISAQNKNNMSNTSNLYGITINDINGKAINLGSYKGKFILFVNVASKCGFTPQYKDLQELHDKQKDKLVVIGVPCNQFGKQEPGSAEEIKAFCSKNYGVEFLITEKIEVKGENQHPLYSWLTDEKINNVKGSTVKWNFQKYLINRDGQLIDFYYSTTSPSSKKIISHIK